MGVPKKVQELQERIKALADAFYAGDVPNNAHAIFFRLTDEEQADFLHFSILKLYMPPAEITEVVEESFDIETFNNIELIRLKIWIVKFLTIFLTIVMGGIGMILANRLLMTADPWVDGGLIYRWLKNLLQT